MRERGATVGKLFDNRSLRKLIVPLIIEQMLAIGVGMVDTIMISVAGEAAVSGVSLVDMINIIIITVFSGLATGGAVVVSQFIGAKQADKVKDSVQQLLAVSLGISVFLMAVLLIFREPVMRLFFGEIEQEVWDSAMEYLLITALSFPMIALYNAGAALYRAIGNSRVSMLISLWSNVANMVGNAIFLFVFHMGVAGVALATLIARLISMVAILLLLARKHQPITWEWRQTYRPNREMIGKILYIGLPSSLENSMFQLGKLVIMSIVAVFGTAHITANAVANNFAALGCIPGGAIGLALLTVVGQCVGARDEAQIRYYTKKLMLILYVTAGVLNVLILLTLPLTMNLYSISSESAQLAVTLTWIHDGLAIFFWPLSFALPNALRAANDVRYTMVVSIFSMIAFRVLFSYILGLWLGMGVVGVWLAMIIDWLFRGAMFVTRVCGKKWIRQAIPEQKELQTNTAG